MAKTSLAQQCHDLANGFPAVLQALFDCRDKSSVTAEAGLREVVDECDANDAFEDGMSSEERVAALLAIIADCGPIEFEEASELAEAIDEDGEDAYGYRWPDESVLLLIGGFMDQDVKSVHVFE